MTEVTRDTQGEPATSVLEIADVPPVVIATGTRCAEAVGILSQADAVGAGIACVVDGQGRLIGLASLGDCLRAPADAPVETAMRRSPRTALQDWTPEAAAGVLTEQDLPLLPVVDGQGRPVAILTPRAAYRFLLDQADEEAHDFVGLVGEPEDDYGDMSIRADFLRRAPWVLMLAVAGLAAGYVVHVYEDALDALVILALYMPMVADTGGNVGTQSASLVTRAISSGRQTLPGSVQVLWRETRVSLMMALCLFLFAYLKVLLISNPEDVPEGLTLAQIAMAIGIALAVQAVSATLIGAALPLGAVAARLDPAVVSGPALTTIVDLTGLILYFGITTQMLGLSGPV